MTQPLVQIVDAALADATRRSGHHLVCNRSVLNAASASSPLPPLSMILLQLSLSAGLHLHLT
jgi:hypothetical protein